MSSTRSTRAVLEDHLACRADDDIESDIARNYAQDVVVITMEGIFEGAEGVRTNHYELRDYLGPAAFSVPIVRVAGRFAFIEWRAELDNRETTDGADTFVIENGRIVCQTIRYTVEKERRLQERHAATDDDAAASGGRR